MTSTIDRLQDELRTLKLINRKLWRRVAEDGRHGRRVRRAHTDAMHIVALGIGYGVLLPSRAMVGEHGISQRRWENAIALMRMARLVTLRPGRGYAWATGDVGTITARIDTALDQAIDQPEAFRARLPHCRNARYDNAS